MKKALQTLTKPRVFIPIVLGAALIVALLSFSDLRKVLRLMTGFQQVYLLYYLLLMVGYEFVRGVQWHYSLGRLNVRAPLGAQILAFALSEVTKVLPIGNYFQNYILQQSEGADIGLTSAATTLFILEEVTVSLVGVVALGLGVWTGWLRSVILVGLAITALVVWLLVRFHHQGSRPEWISRHRSFQMVADEFAHFREGAVDLLHPRPLAVTLACSVTYLVIGGTALYIVVLGLGVTHATFTEALAVYFFSLAVALMLPIPVDIGVIEVSGVGAFVTVGVNRDAAIGAVFVNRILSILASIAIAAVVMLILHKEVRELYEYVIKKKRRDDTERDHAEGGHDERDRSDQSGGRKIEPQASQSQDSHALNAVQIPLDRASAKEVATRWISRARRALKRQRSIRSIAGAWPLYARQRANSV